jgi:cell division protein FtsI/penicillin-binding protein 2
MAAQRRKTAKPKAKTASPGGFVAAGVVSAVFIAAAAAQARAHLLMEKPKTASRAAASQDLKRGPIRSREGDILSQSTSQYELRIGYAKTPTAPGYFASLSAITGLASGDLAAFGSQPNSRTWRVVLSPSQVKALGDLNYEWKADGVGIKSTSNRSIVAGPSFGGIVGAVKIEEGRPEGLTGLEREMAAFLTGEGPLPEGLVGLTPEAKKALANLDTSLESSRSLRLSVQTRLQDAAFNAIRKAGEASGAAMAAAVVIENKSGSVLALANWPTFDPAGAPKKGTEFNAAVQGRFEPGSTFKLLTLAQALQAGTLRPGQLTNSVARLPIGRSASVGNHDDLTFGMIDEREAIARSCNTSAAQWAGRLGQARLFDFYTKIGLARPTRLGLTGEANAKAILSKDKGAPDLQAANWGFGQAVNCTPLQLAAAYSMLGNGGELMEPRLVLEAGGVALKPESRGKFLRPEVCQQVLRAAEDVINQDYGTGHSLAIPGLPMAGKTGTAQKLGSGKDASRMQYVASFVGYFPMPNPKYTVLVMVDDPKSEFYGGAVAGPPYREIVLAMIEQGLVKAAPQTGAAERYNGADERSNEGDSGRVRPVAQRG